MFRKFGMTILLVSMAIGLAAWAPAYANDAGMTGITPASSGSAGTTGVAVAPANSLAASSVRTNDILSARLAAGAPLVVGKGACLTVRKGMLRSARSRHLLDCARLNLLSGQMALLRRGRIMANGRFGIFGLPMQRRLRFFYFTPRMGTVPNTTSPYATSPNAPAGTGLANTNIPGYRVYTFKTRDQANAFVQQLQNGSYNLANDFPGMDVTHPYVWVSRNGTVVYVYVGTDAKVGTQLDRLYGMPVFGCPAAGATNATAAPSFCTAPAAPSGTATPGGTTTPGGSSGGSGGSHY